MHIDLKHLSDDDTINILPTCTSSGIKKTVKKLKDSIKITFVYYSGVNRINVIHRVPNMDKKELNIKIKNFIEEIEGINKIDDIFEIKKGDLTLDIIDKFRYCPKYIEYDEQHVLIDPYILGMWLGDGYSNISSIKNIDIPLIDIWCNYAKDIGLQITKSFDKIRDKVNQLETKEMCGYHITSGTYSGKMNRNHFKEWLKKYNLIKNKHIPDCYLKNSKDIRLQLLAGLIDTDGSIDSNKYSITQKSKKLSNDIVKLCESLGFFTETKLVEKCCTQTGAVNFYYKVELSLSQVTPIIPVVLERKKMNKIKNYNNPKIIIEGVEIKKRMEWNDDARMTLYQMVKRFKFENGDMPIPWRKFVKLSDNFSEISHNSLRVEWKNSEKIVNLDDIKLFEGEFNLADDNWMKQYNSIISKLKLNIKLIKSDINWINNQKQRKAKYKCEEDMLLKIPQYAITDVDRWNDQYDSIVLSIKEGLKFNSKQKIWLASQKKKKKFRDGEKEKYEKLLKMME